MTAADSTLHCGFCTQRYGEPTRHPPELFRPAALTAGDDERTCKYAEGVVGGAPSNPPPPPAPAATTPYQTIAAAVMDRYYKELVVFRTHIQAQMAYNRQVADEARDLDALAGGTQYARALLSTTVNVDTADVKRAHDLYAAACRAVGEAPRAL